MKEPLLASSLTRKQTVASALRQGWQLLVSIASTDIIHSLFPPQPHNSVPTFNMKPPRTLPRLTSHPFYICRSCQHKPSQTQQFSTSSSLRTPPTTGYAYLPSRRLISLTGPDSTRYLQGSITANISPASAIRKSGFYAAFLNAQGRILNDVFIYPDPTSLHPTGEAWLIEVDANEAERLAKHIKRYKLRAKYDVRLLAEGEKTVWSAWNEEGWTAHVMSRSDGPGKSGSGLLSCEDARAPGMGRRLVLDAGKKPEEDVDEVAESVYRIRRYLKGVAEGQDELIGAAALPQESNIDFMGGIDYRKGCYVGQELTIRTHHTGVVRKRILPVMFYGKEAKEPEALEYDTAADLGVEGIPKETSIGRFEKRGRSAGKILAGVGNVGLGLCRLEIMTDVVVQGEAGGFKPGDEFKVEWEGNGEGVGNMVKVKAFVPNWHLKKSG